MTAEQEPGAPEYIGTATYSPEDNKIRITPFRRLDKETYTRVRATGFIWAPKQEIFVAPMWTPSRFDLAMELCGEVEDEDKSLVERAEERADRFEGYSEKRAADAHSARKRVEEISNGIPMGQPILIGHHSEKHARRDAERIRSGMNKAVQMWETSKYWEQRAAGSLAAAKYKEKPGVRARRIKGLQADQRKAQRDQAEAQKWLDLWSKDGLTKDEARAIANYCWLKLPRKEGDRPDFTGNPSAYDALNDEPSTLFAPRSLAEIVDYAKAAYPRTIARAQRWIDHYALRLTYETAMLQEQGAAHLLEKAPRPKQPPILNYRGTITVRNRYNREPDTMTTEDMTKAEWAQIGDDYKGTRLSLDGTHRVRIAYRGSKSGLVYLTDGPKHARPEPEPVKRSPAIEAELRALDAADEARSMAAEAPPAPAQVPSAPEAEEGDLFEAMKGQLKAGIKVVVAPQLFETPPDVAARMATEAGLFEGCRVLEPSAGTGRLVDAMHAENQDRGYKTDLEAVEINQELAHRLRFNSALTHDRVWCEDFLDTNPAQLGLFDRVIMNPPFKDGADIKHILHALKFLKPGGRLVAICAGGPRQQRELEPRTEATGGIWEPLPPGTFKDAGTNVNTVLLIINT